MIPETRDPNRPDEDHHEITPTQLFTAFSNERRQFALAYLVQKPAAIAVGDLAEYISIKEGEPSYERYERVLTDLAHRHLPHLRDAGIIRYSETDATVELAIERRVMAPYLELSDHVDA